METNPERNPTTYTEVYMPPPRIIGRALVHPQPYEVTRVRTALPPPPLQYYGPREEGEQYVPNVPQSFHQTAASGNESVVPIYSSHDSNHDDNRYLEQFPGNIPGLPPGHVRFYTPSPRQNHQRYESSVSQNVFGTITSPQANRGGMEQHCQGASHTILSGQNGKHEEQLYNGEDAAHSMTHDRLTENNWNNTDSRNSVPALGSMTLTIGELSTSLETQEADQTFQNWHAATTEQQGQWGLQSNEETTSLNSVLYSEEFFEKELNYPVSSSGHQNSPVSYNNQAPPPSLYHMMMPQQQRYNYRTQNPLYPVSFQQHQQMNMARAPQNIIRERHDQYFQPSVERNTDLRKLRNERRRSTRRPREATSRFSQAVSHVYPPHGPQRGRGCSNQWSGGVVEVGYNMPALPSSSGVETSSSASVVTKNQEEIPTAIAATEVEIEAPCQPGNNSTLGQPESEQPASTCEQQSNAPTLARFLDASHLNKTSGTQTQGWNPIAVDVNEGEVECVSQSGNNSSMGQPETDQATRSCAQRSNAPTLARLLDAPCLNKAGGADKFESLLFAALAKVAQPGGEEAEVNSNAADVVPERRPHNRGKVLFEVDENNISDEEQGQGNEVGKDE